ncbi:MAG: carboxymuconolactone decarboxylase family protein [Trebonia sp.]
MTSVVYPPATREIGDRRRELAPQIHEAFDAFSRQVFADGALPAKTRQLIAAAHVTQCPYCIRGHTQDRPPGGRPGGRRAARRPAVQFAPHP